MDVETTVYTRVTVFVASAQQTLTSLLESIRAAKPSPRSPAPHRTHVGIDIIDDHHGRPEVLATLGDKRLCRRGATVFGGEIVVPTDVLPRPTAPQNYRPTTRKVLLAFEVVIELDATKHGRFGMGKEKHKRTSKRLRVELRIDDAEASRVVFVPDIEGEWHGSSGFNCAAAYVRVSPFTGSSALCVLLSRVTFLAD
jgi:hypothetical protein